MAGAHGTCLASAELRAVEHGAHMPFHPREVAFTCITLLPKERYVASFHAESKASVLPELRARERD